MSLSLPEALYEGLSTDPKPDDPDIQVGKTFYELDTQVTYYWTGSNWKTYEQLYKEGRWIGITSTGGTSGILQGILAGVGTFVRTFDTPNGLHQNITTSSTINSFAGLRTNIGYAERGLNPYTRVTFRLNQVSDCRFYCGWTGYLAALAYPGTGSDPYPANSAIGVRLDANVADFELYHNDASDPSTIEGTTVGVADTEIHTFEIRAINSVPKYQYKWDHAFSWTDITTDIPLETTEMALAIWIENTVATAKSFKLIDVYARIDNKG